MSGGLTGTHVANEGGWIADANAQDVAINANTAGITTKATPADVDLKIAAQMGVLDGRFAQVAEPLAVKTTGAQDVAGVKNFTSTPTINGAAMISRAEFTALNADVVAIKAQLAMGTDVAPQWYSSQAPAATVGVAYSFTFIATGTPAPTYSVTGSLPTGLSFATNGALTGTPTTAGAFTFTVTAANGVAPSISAVRTVTTVAAGGVSTMYNPAVYGSGVGFDSKANIVISGDESMAMRFKAGTTSTLTGIQWTQRTGPTGYSLGTGGTTTITIRPDNGSGFPSATVLATTTWAGGNPGAQEKYDICGFVSPASLTAGTVYYAVFENASTANYVSANCGYTRDNHVGPKQPKFSDAEFGILLTTSYGGAWSKTVNNAAGYTPVVDLIYANGYHDGQAYYENIGVSGYYAVISGTASMVRESFTVSGGNRTVTQAGVMMRRQSGTSPLILTLETAAGALIDSVSIPATSVPISAAGVDSNPGATWVSGSFGASKTLTNGVSYNLRLSTAGGTTYSIDQLRNAAENYYGFQSYDFTDGIPYYTTNGSTWAKCARDYMSTETWDLPFYLSS